MSQAAINTAIEEKLAKLTNQAGRDRDRDRIRGKQAEGPAHRPATAVCTFCNRSRHTAENCYKRQHAEQSAGRPSAPGPSSPRPPTAYMTKGSASEEKGLRYESAFMAILQDNALEVKQPELQPLSEADNLPVLIDIPGTGSAFSDPLTPIRYPGLCCGASMHLVKSPVLRGRYFAELYLRDKDPMARKVAVASIQQIIRSYPASFSPTVRDSVQAGVLFDLIPQDVTQIDASSILRTGKRTDILNIPDARFFGRSFPIILLIFGPNQWQNSL